MVESISKVEWKELLGTDYRPFGTSLNLQENNLIKDVNEDFLKELTSFEVFFNNFKDKFKIDENLIGGRVINYWFIYIYTGNFSNKKKSL
nr:hypothetical protein [uncultured Empedobacter sp.]